MGDPPLVGTLVTYRVVRAICLRLRYLLRGHGLLESILVHSVHTYRK